MEISNEQVCSKIIRFIRKEVKKRSAQVVVVGISGGIDSAVAVALAAQALGPDKVFGLLLPDSSVTPKKDTSHALELVRGLKSRYKTIELKTLRKHLLQRLPNNKLAGGSTICRRSTKPLLYRGLSTMKMVLLTFTYFWWRRRWNISLNTNEPIPEYITCSSVQSKRRHHASFLLWRHEKKVLSY